MTDKTDTPTYADKVTTLASTLVKDDKGKWQAPEGIEPDEGMMHAAKLELRNKDTQSAYTKSQQSLKAAESTNSQMAEHLLSNATLHITSTQREELDDLKISDPDAWRDKVNEYEGQAKKLLTDKISGFNTEGKKLSELETRQAKMKVFTETTGIKLDDDIIASELPASFMKSLEKGTSTFDEFLIKAQKFLSKNIKIAGANEEDPEDEVNLSKTAGGDKPSDQAQGKDDESTYASEIF